ncbi:hypothetical protein [Mesorhizobium sp. M1322]|uniref:hypothetical protein n=1 Tax=Mesorhizobium sp. M1322 TaxID=2957081 RepID=UPI003336024A
MHTFKPTFAFKTYRIGCTFREEKDDGITSLTVEFHLVRDPNNPKESLLLDFFKSGRSELGFTSDRLEALINSTRGSYDDGGDVDLVGRYVCIKNGGKTESDFASLEIAFAYHRADVEAFKGMLAYLEECRNSVTPEATTADELYAKYLDTGVEAYARMAQRAA